MDKAGGQMVVERFVIRKNRFYVVTEIGTMPRANWVWLQSNPSFKKIPKGYVVHHLDGDSTNDDPSNLVIMAKHHHTAHHLKKITFEVPIDFISEDPEKKPTVCFEKSRNLYYLLYRKGENGTRKRFRIWRDSNNEFFRTKEEAEKYADKIYPS